MVNTVLGAAYIAAIVAGLIWQATREPELPTERRFFHD